MSYELPLTITIPIPQQIPQGRGANATGHRGGNLRIRCTDKEYDKIQEEAEKLGLSLAMFCRWSITRVANNMRSHRLALSTSATVGDEDG